MKVVRYVGEDPALQGRHAVVAEDDGDLYSVQFDFAEGVPIEAQDPRCFGWHWYRRSEFTDLGAGE